MKTISLILLCLLFVTACDRQEINRKTMNSPDAISLSDTSNALPEFKTSLNEQEYVSSCEQLERLNSAITENTPIYEFLSQFQVHKSRVIMQTNIKNSPFYKYFFANTFNKDPAYKIPTNNEVFIDGYVDSNGEEVPSLKKQCNYLSPEDKKERSKDPVAYDKANPKKDLSLAQKAKCSYLDGGFLVKKVPKIYALGKNCFETPDAESCSNLRLEKVFDSLDESFPGIKGVNTSSDYDQLMKKSVFFNSEGKKPVLYSLLNKVVKNNFDQLSDQAIQNISRPLPLLYGQDWMQVSTNEENILASAIHDLSSKDVSQRTCSLVLWRRLFNQLLTFKGYDSPKLTKIKSSFKNSLNYNYPNNHKLPKLTDYRQGFDNQEIESSYFTSLKSPNKKIVLNDYSIINYSPEDQALTIKPLEKKSSSLTNHLSFLHLMATSFEATSPFSKWNTNEYLVIGDFTNQKTSALIPKESHDLSLGLLSMTFKNIAAYHSKYIDLNNKALPNKNGAAGFLIGTMKDKDNMIISLKEVNQLMIISANLQQSVGNILSGPEQDTPKFYPEETLTLLKLFKTTLSELNLPLILLSKKMNNNNSCIAELLWNTKNGKIKPIKKCSKELIQDTKYSLNHLAKKIKNRALYTN